MLGPVLAALYHLGRIQVTDAKMDVRSFGDALIETRDLDPVYCGLVGAQLPEPQLCRWLLAYWCFYHVGVASALSDCEGQNYWAMMKIAAENQIDPHHYSSQMPYKLPSGRWPRAAERRHFRGQKCVDAVEWLRDNVPGDPLNDHPAEGWVRLLSCRPLTDKSIMNCVQTWPMFGPWIAFKVADMMERVYGSKIKFDPNLGLMYEEPRKGLHLLINQPPGTEFNTVGDAYNQLSHYFANKQAPPQGDRPCGPQEVETVLCKWKSHMGGHYWVSKDIHEQRQALAGWGPTAEKIAAAYPPEVSWCTFDKKFHEGGDTCMGHHP